MQRFCKRLICKNSCSTRLASNNLGQLGFQDVAGAGRLPVGLREGRRGEGTGVGNFHRHVVLVAKVRASRQGVGWLKFKERMHNMVLMKKLPL